MNVLTIEQLPFPLAVFASITAAAIEAALPEPQVLELVGEAMSDLVANDDWLDDSDCQPHPEFYQQYLLYADPDDRFSIVSFVWGPGQTTPIHNHTVWGCIGMLRGMEVDQAFVVDAQGKPQPSGSELLLHPGQVSFVSPVIGDVHQVSNALADQVSISIHVYGANIGKVERQVYPAEGGAAKAFISGYSQRSWSR